MKVLLGATAAVLLLASPALAQTNSALPQQCASFTPAPAIPDGATASNSAMRTARDALAEWQQTRSAELAACQAATQALEAQAQASANAHNAALAETNAAITQFTAENEEYSARGNTSSGRERGGVITRTDH